MRGCLETELTSPPDELQFRAWRAFLYAYSVVVPTLSPLIGNSRVHSSVFQIDSERHPD
jgi:hypothetical protein